MQLLVDSNNRNSLMFVCVHTLTCVCLQSCDRMRWCLYHGHITAPAYMFDWESKGNSQNYMLATILMVTKYS